MTQEGDVLKMIVVEAQLTKQGHPSHNILRCRWVGHPPSMDTWEREDRISLFEHEEKDPMFSFRLRQEGMSLTEARMLTRGKREQAPQTPANMFLANGPKSRVVVMVKYGVAEKSPLVTEKSK